MTASPPGQRAARGRPGLDLGIRAGLDRVAGVGTGRVAVAICLAPAGTLALDAPPLRLVNHIDRNAQFESLPGWDLVAVGLRDVAAGRTSIEALLLWSASQRLSAAGFTLPGPVPDNVTGRLFELLVATVGREGAHARYNALRRRLLSFLRSVDAPAT